LGKWAIAAFTNCYATYSTEAWRSGGTRSGIVTEIFDSLSEKFLFSGASDGQIHPKSKLCFKSDF
jgi:hypothetical protein